MPQCWLKQGNISILVTPLLLSDFYAAWPSLRVSIKQQCFCLDKSRLILLLKMTKGTYALRNDIYAATPFLRVSIKKQCFCLAEAGLVFVV